MGQDRNEAEVLELRVGDGSADGAAVRPLAEPIRGRLGDFDVLLDGDERGGTLVLQPANGQALTLSVRGDELTLRWEGRHVLLEAPGASMKLAAKNVEIAATDSLTLHAGKEVDIHSREDVEVRADHHVNLWGHGVLVGD